MYDMKKTIEHWKSAFAQNEACGQEDVEELEGHLREQIGSLVESGLSEKEAFVVARSRLGDPEQICTQFAQANPSLLWQRRLFWMAAGVFCWILISWLQGVLMGIAAGAALLLGDRVQVDLSVVYGVTHLVLLLALLGFGRALYRHGLPTVTHSRFAACVANRPRRLACLGLVLVVGYFGYMIPNMMVRLANVSLVASARPQVISVLIGLSMALPPITIIAFVVLRIGRQSEGLISAVDR